LTCLDTGLLFAWGANLRGQLGLGDTGMRSTPTLVKFFENVSVVDIYAGGYGDENFSFAITNTKIYCWGANSFGQLGLGHLLPIDTYLPTLFTSLKDVKTFGLCNYHTLALTNSKKVYSWGKNDHHCLGRGCIHQHDPCPGEITTLADKDIIAVAGGNDLTVALSARGIVYTIGNNNNGQQGQFTSSMSKVPEPLSTLLDHKIVQIAVCNWHVILLDSNERLFAFGKLYNIC
jgi:alpha-tubulin suppressor-like RCC1 family protein